MNVERLKSIVDGLLKDEKEIKLQEYLSNLNAALSNLTNAPADAQKQVEVSEKLKLLNEQVNKLISRYDSAQLKTLETIGAHNFFSKDLVEAIQKAITENSMTPAVVQRQVGELLSRRQVYIQELDSIAKNFEALSIKADNLETGTAEIGFRIPRSLFKNELEGLIEELRAIKFIIRTFSEIATGSVEAIEIKQISTTDPLFFFGLDPITIAKIGGAITWALHTWKQVEEIRVARANTQKLKGFTDDDIKGFFDRKIKETIAKAIADKTTELVGNLDGNAGRKEEHKSFVARALESILARVERGMTVEIQFLPPPQPELPTEEGKEQQKANVFDTLKEIAPQLVFPLPDNSPILGLPSPEPENTKTEIDDKGAKKPK